MNKQIIAASLCAGLAAGSLPAAAGDLNAEMQQMFNDLGTVGNVTSPGAFRGQTMNTMTGGNLMMRTPGKNYQLGSVALPSLKAGCGGIDVFGGSFSFINKAQFTAMLQNIGANATGYAFQLAIDSISPLIGVNLKDLMDKLQKMNAVNINSCQAAQSLVNGVWGKYDTSMMSGCANITQYLGSVVDRTEGTYNCATQAPGVMNTAAASSDPTQHETNMVRGNVMWEAMSKISTISTDEKEFVMSLVGTYIVRNATTVGANPAIEDKAPTITSIRDFMLGENGGTAALIPIPVYYCNGDAECLNPVVVNRQVKPFSSLVEDRLRSLSNKIKTRAAPTAQDLGFINQTSLPVYKMLAVANSRPDSGIDESLILTYKDLIALDYAETFLRRTLRVGLLALNAPGGRNSLEADKLATLSENVKRAITDISIEKNAILTQLPAIQSVSTHIQNLERQLWSDAPASVKTALDYSRLSSRR